ncbi:MAG: aryl-sulfate sulfotransferase [Pseudomonadota bacterium]|nr:aryl-sulfate sulfotransferase [Pseudomonadota bacterium]
MLLMFLGCVQPSDPPTTDEPPVEEPVGDLRVEDLTAELATMPTVVWARWHTTEPTRATVTATFEEGAVVVEEAELATDHAVLLAGLPALTDVTVAVRLDVPDMLPTEATITTGALPSWVPDVKYRAEVPEASTGGYTITPLIDLENGGIVVFDSLGRPVWAQARVDLDVGSVGFITRARLSLDGNAIVYNGMAEGVDATGAIVRLPLDGSAATVLPVTGIHTDFVELPTGGYAALGWDVRELDGRTIVGETILEVGLDGATHVIWSVFDDYTPDLSVSWPHWYPGDLDAEDWSHVNGISYDAGTDDYYVTMTWNDGVARIDRGTGDLVWTLTDEGGDFARVGDGRLVNSPHSVQPVDGGVLVFNRGDPGDPASCSEATTIALDAELGTAERVDGYTSEVCLLVTFLGSAHRLPNGNQLVTFTTAGQIDEVTPEGELAWRVNSTLGAGFGFSERAVTLGDGTP